MSADDDDIWGDLFFPGFSPAAQRFWLRFEEVTEEIHYVVSFFNFYISFPGFILNLFHFVILTRKPMMTSSMNIITIGICVCDFIMTFNLSLEYIHNKIIVSKHTSPNGKCFPPQGVLSICTVAVFSFASYTFKRCAVWLGVLLAGARTIVIKDPLHFRATTLMSPRFGFIGTLSTFLIAAPLPLLQLSSQRIHVVGTWTPSPNCSGFPVNYSQPEFYFMPDDSLYGPELRKVLISVDSWMYRIIPSILLPTLTVILIVELRKARVRRKRLGSSQDITGDRTTRFVLYMTVCFVFAEAPQGIILLLTNLSLKYQGFINILNQLIAIFLAADTVNSITHIFICFFMSSQYQKTVKKMLRIKESLVYPIGDVSSTHPNMRRPPVKPG